MSVLLCFFVGLHCYLFALLISYAINFRQCNFSRVHLNWLIRFYLIERFLKLGGIDWLLPELCKLLLMISHWLSILALVLLLSLLQIIIVHSDLILGELVAIKHSVFLVLLLLLLLYRLHGGKIGTLV
jgi:hypothetical protein